MKMNIDKLRCIIRAKLKNISSDRYFSFGHKIYFYERKDAEQVRKRGQRIFHAPHLGYYIVTPQKSGFSY